MAHRIAVGVSGTGSNLQALHAAAARGAHDEPAGARYEIALVFADRPCAALDWAVEQGIETLLVPAAPRGDDAARAEEDRLLAESVAAVAPELVVLAGYMRITGPAMLAAFPGRMLNLHPALLPAFPGAHGVRDALAAGVKVTGVTVHFVDSSLDGGPIVLQDSVPVLPGDTEETLFDRIHAVEHRLLPRAVGLALAGALTIEPDGRTVRVDAARAAEAMPVPRRALLSVSDKTGLPEFGAGLVRLGFELVSTGGTARALRSAGLPVTDVAAVTGFPEMLDGRVKTLHPRVHGGILADRRLASHREQLAAAAIDPFDLVVVNLYPFAAAAEKPGISFDDLVEEIDIGGPSMVRAAAKNHASVAIVTSPSRYAAVLEELETNGRVGEGLRSALAVEAFRHTGAYDARIAAELPARMAAAGVALPDEPGLPGSADPYPPTLVVGLEKVETLRYGENPHQRAARYRRPGTGKWAGPFAMGGTILQGKALSYNNVLDASGADAIARQLRGPACVVVKHTNPCGAAERPTLAEAWKDALAGDPASAYGGVVALTREVDAATAEGLASIFLEVIVAPSYSPEALAILARKTNLRLLEDPILGSGQAAPAPDPLGSIRVAGGGVLVTAADVLPDDPATWKLVTSRAPTDREMRDLDLAWRLCRGVVSNAIVLVKDGMEIGLGSGQTSRVDAARQAVAKAIAFHGQESLRGAACGSDAFYPFPDAVQVCLDAGVTAYAQPGGSMRDAEVIEVAEKAGVAMLVTGVRHFRH
ncbi:MAG: bifunctional phosphoribosylaminoimidazolecarboxamide formyltransferase/IMP cyclohydrolase [Candidatus Limnocylindrales bacterium]